MVTKMIADDELEEMKCKCGGTWIHQFTDLAYATYKCDKCHVVKCFPLLKNSWDDFE